MSGNASLRSLSRHLPLLRVPLLLNNVIALTLSGICSGHPIYVIELVFLSISFIAGSFDLIRYAFKRRAARRGRANVEQDDVGGSFAKATGDCALSVILLPTWIIGLVVSSQMWHYGWMTAVVATFGAFIAWSLHLTSFAVEAYVWASLYRPAVRRCPSCGYNLNSTAALTIVTGSHGQSNPQPQPQPQPQLLAQEPNVEVGSSSANEYDEGETDRLILKDDERKS